MKPSNYTLTLSDWNDLEELSRKADEALTNLRLSILMLHKGDEKTDLFLCDLAESVPSLGRLIPYMLHPQPEWTGGDSSDPKNTVYREPHIVGNFPGRLKALH